MLYIVSGSLIAPSWRNMMEEMENTAKVIRQNADSIETKCLDALNTLYIEKRKARKLYQEEHARILQQFTHVSFSIHLFIAVVNLEAISLDNYPNS